MKKPVVPVKQMKPAPKVVKAVPKPVAKPAGKMGTFKKPKSY